MKGPRLGAHMSIAGGIDKAVDRGLQTGCDTIQIFSKNASQWGANPIDDQTVDAFKTGLAATSIEPVVCHDSYLINLGSPDENGLLKRSREAFIDELQRCEQLGIPYLVTHPGSHLGEGVEAGIARIAASIDFIHEQTAGFNVMALLETTAGQGTNIGFRFEQIRDIIDQVRQPERLGVCLDTCHIFAAGYDIGSAEGYEQTWQDFDAIIGLDRLKVIHLNDSKKDLGSRVDRHDHIGTGAIGLEAFERLMNDGRLRHIPMILETPKGQDMAEDVENLAILRGLVTS